MAQKRNDNDLIDYLELILGQRLSWFWYDLYDIEY